MARYFQKSQAFYCFSSDSARRVPGRTLTHRGETYACLFHLLEPGEVLVKLRMNNRGGCVDAMVIEDDLDLASHRRWLRRDQGETSESLAVELQ